AAPKSEARPIAGRAVRRRCCGWPCSAARACPGAADKPPVRRQCPLPQPRPEPGRRGRKGNGGAPDQQPHLVSKVVIVNLAPRSRRGAREEKSRWTEN